jgi:probable rRNA maturation factor
MIHVANRSHTEVPTAKLVAAAECALRAEDAAHLDLSIAVVTDAEIHLLNRSYLKHDYPTDVISFPLRDGPDPDPLLGEVIVSADRARHEARSRGIGFVEELCRYVVHGTLHLLGYDDREAEKREEMHARQEEILEQLAGRAKPAKKAAAVAAARPKVAAKKGAGPKPKAKKKQPAPARAGAAKAKPRARAPKKR